ncbi:MAG TPA: L-threonylcarbamoyladenylate synthase, partial [Pyrinomonadaceae bacterium]
MKTILTKSPSEAAAFIRRGGLSAFPTETVYGLGADVFDERAVEKIFIAKARPPDNPLIAHVGSLEQIELLASEVTPAARKFIEAFFPSPLTLVLPKAKKVPLIATANLQTIGVRMPDSELAREFLKACETPVVAPSANLSGKPSPTTWQAVFEDLNGRIDCILQGEMTEIGLESTVVDCTSNVPLVLRAGAVTLEDLRKIVPETRIYRVKENEAVKSPGLRHRHYSPRAKVILISD